MVRLGQLYGLLGADFAHDVALGHFSDEGASLGLWGVRRFYGMAVRSRSICTLISFYHHVSPVIQMKIRS